tara:strand:+ start:102 stop:275 length:174 start_codon:yes stop_codon:yes gene_type:complete
MRKTGQVIKKNEVSEQRDFSSTVTKQERDFESGVSVERPTRKVREVVILNGKTYYIV